MSSPSKRRRNLIRLLPIVALAAMMSMQPASLSGGIGRGRDFAKCLVTCNSARRDCRTTCRSTCRSLFSSRRDQRVCVRACRSDCNDVAEQCRQDCKAGKPPPTPFVP